MYSSQVFVDLLGFYNF